MRGSRQLARVGLLMVLLAGSAPGLAAPSDSRMAAAAESIEAAISQRHADVAMGFEVGRQLELVAARR
jgi:hypothetical protein